MVKAKPYQPRPYQRECIKALAEARRQGTKSGLVVMAGGLGKTVTVIFDVEQYLDEYPNARILYLCDQESILNQNRRKFRVYFGEERSYGLYSGTSKTLHRVDFLFATLQSVRDHREDFVDDDYDYIIVDEAHHTSADTYEPIIKSFCPQFLVGLTATPDREDGRNILNVYQNVLFEMDIYQGWAEGWLTRAHYELMLDDVDEQQLRAYLGPEGAGLKVSMAQLNRSLFIPQRDEEIVASARERIASAGIEDPRIFAFCSNITYAESMAKHFGDGAAVVHSGQSRALNEAILNDFRSGKLNTVIAVDMLNEGIDVPEANVLIFLRATEAKRIFFQQLARGLRLSPGKDFALVLDYVCSIERIATVLEMEQSSQERCKSIPSYPSSAKRLSPITVNIPATPRFRIQRVDLEQLIKKARNGLTWSDEEILENYIKLIKDLGETRLPTDQEIDDYPLLPSNVTVRNRFGTRSNLAYVSGYNHLIPTEEEKYDQGLQLLHDKWVKDGKVPTKISVDVDKTMLSSSTYARRYGSFIRALVLAGVPASRGIDQLNQIELKILKHTVITIIQERERHKQSLKYRDIFCGESPILGKNILRKLFDGKCTKLLAEAGIQPNRRSCSKQWSRSELIEFLQEHADSDGYAPSRRALQEIDGSPACTRFIAEFITYERAVIAAGLKIRKGGRKREKLTD